MSRAICSDSSTKLAVAHAPGAVRQPAGMAGPFSSARTKQQERRVECS